MKIKTLFWKRKKQPTKAEITAFCEGKGKFVAISPAIFGGWMVWIEARKELILSSPVEVSGDAILDEYRRLNKSFKITNSTYF